MLRTYAKLVWKCNVVLVCIKLYLYPCKNNIKSNNTCCESCFVKYLFVWFVVFIQLCNSCSKTKYVYINSGILFQSYVPIYLQPCLPEAFTFNGTFLLCYLPILNPGQPNLKQQVKVDYLYFIFIGEPERARILQRF